MAGGKGCQAELVVVTDSKGNYDHLHNETTGPAEDRRTAIELSIVREDLSRPGCHLRCVDAKSQVADTLTKLRGDSDLLRGTCRAGRLVIVEADELLALKKQEKEERLRRLGRDGKKKKRVTLADEEEASGEPRGEVAGK